MQTVDVQETTINAVNVAKIGNETCLVLCLRFEEKDGELVQYQNMNVALTEVNSVRLLRDLLNLSKNSPLFMEAIRKVPDLYRDYESVVIQKPRS